MRFSYNTFNRSSAWGVPPTLPEQFRAAADAGYDAVGIDLQSVEAHVADGMSLRALTGELVASGLPCHELVWLTVSTDAARTQRGIERALPLIEAFTPEQVLVFVTGQGTDVGEQLGRCAARLADVGTATSVEFITGQPVASLADALELTRTLPGEVGVVVDAWHFHHSSDSFDDLGAVPPERIGFIQLCDVLEPDSAELAVEMMQHRGMPGDGVADLARFCAAVAATGYDGVASVEVLSRHWRDADLDTYVTRSLEASRATWATRS